jgi:hypothetical protein
MSLGSRELGTKNGQKALARASRQDIARIK